METDNVPAFSEKDAAEGGIIFDNTFDDGLNDKIKNQKKVSRAANVKKFLKSDRRLHLTEYRVKRNDNLSVIAKKNGIKPGLLAEINNIKNPGMLRPGDTLLVPSKKGVFYTIRKGDTLAKIAKEYKTEIDIIAEHNNIDVKKIIAGRKIFLPGAESPEKKLHLKHKNRNRNADSENTDKIAAKDSEKTKDHPVKGKLVLSWPLRGPITSGFGVRTHPFSGHKKFHCGLDIGAEVGTPVRAAGDGTVIYSGWKEVYGNIIVISHKNDYITVYGHNSKNLVDVNEKVRKGQKIALSGKTGAVTGAHLHFEIRKGMVPLNPVRILK
jgi:murein DD-endopeptidase MepM/ murein hydrolase activator NlpD